MKGQVIGQGGIKIANVNYIDAVVNTGETIAKGDQIDFTFSKAKKYFESSLIQKTDIAIYSGDTPGDPAFVKLSETQFIWCAYVAAALRIESVTLTGDSTLSQGGETQVIQYGYEPKLLRISNTQALLVYHNNNNNTAYCRTVNLSGNTITLGAETLLNNSGSGLNSYSIEPLDTQGEFLYLFVDRGSSNALVAHKLTVSGTTVTRGTAISIMNNAWNLDKNMPKFANNTFLVTFTQDVSNYNGRLMLIRYNSDNTISKGTVAENVFTSQNYLSSLKIDESAVVCASFTSATVTGARVVNVNPSTLTIGVFGDIVNAQSGANQIYFSLILISKDVFGIAIKNALYFLKRNANSLSVISNSQLSNSVSTTGKTMIESFDGNRLFAICPSSGLTAMYAMISKISPPEGFALSGGTAGQTIKVAKM